MNKKFFLLILFLLAAIAKPAQAALQPLTTLEAENMPTKTTGGAVTGGWNIWSNGYIEQSVSFPTAATYEFQIFAKGDNAGGAWPIMELRIDQVVKATFTVNTGNYTYYNTQISVPSGSHNVAIAFTNDYYAPPADRNLYVDKTNILQVVPDLPPSSPVLNDAVPNDKQVTLSWNSVSGATGYKVTYQNISGGTTTKDYTQDSACVAAYVLDEASGSIVDKCGNDDTGNISGSVLQNVTGKYNKGIEFKGTGGGGNNAYVSFGSGATLDNLTARTIVAWVKPDNLGESNGGVILSKNYQDGWVVRLASGNNVAFSQAFSGGVVTWTTTTGPITIGSFNHIAIKYSAATTTTVPQIYVNGVNQTVSGGTPFGTRDNDGNYALNMGIETNVQEFDGVIDEVGVFNRVLTDAEITELMNGGLTGSLQGGSTTTTVDVGNVSQSTIANLTNGTSYEFKVRAYNAAGESADSIAKNATPHVPMEFVKNVDYNAAGQMTKVEYGNGAITTYTYDPLSLQLTRLKTTDKNNVVIQDLTYQYDSVGNILNITDAVHFDTQSFQYDALNRLTQATGNNYGTKAYSYDEIGNITSKEGVSYTYAQNGAGPHAVTALSDGTAMTYDTNGNMITKNKAGIITNYEYDVENRLLRVKNGSTTIEEYEYDGDGGRTKKITYDTQNPTVTTKFVGSLYEEANNRYTDHIFLGDKRIATINNGAVVFIHENHLGSANIITDSTGLIKELIEYKPYGEFARHEKYGSGEDVAWFYFTGQRFDDKTGLYYYNARYYDPSLGRFLTPDTIVQSPSNPQTFNRYTYANNNPVNNIDPDGHGWFRKFIGKVVGAFAAAAVFFGTGGNIGAAANTYNSVESIISPAANNNWGQAGVNALNAFAMGSGNPYFMVSGALGMLSYRTGEQGYNDLSRTLGYASQAVAAAYVAWNVGVGVKDWLFDHGSYYDVDGTPLTKAQVIAKYGKSGAKVFTNGVNQSLDAALQMAKDNEANVLFYNVSHGVIADFTESTLGWITGTGALDRELGTLATQMTVNLLGYSQGSIISANAMVWAGINGGAMPGSSLGTMGSAVGSIRTHLSAWEAGVSFSKVYGNTHTFDPIKLLSSEINPVGYAQGAIGLATGGGQHVNY